MILPFLLVALAQTAPASPPAPPPASRGMGMRGADADGDEVVTRQEVIVQADARFARMDADHNGVVTVEERRAAMADRPGRGGEARGGGREGDLTIARFREMTTGSFDRRDTNHDGKLDAAELAAGRSGPGRRGGDGPPPPPER